MIQLKLSQLFTLILSLSLLIINVSCSIDTIPFDSIDVGDVLQTTKHDNLINQLKLYLNLLIPQKYKQYQYIGFIILTFLQSQLLKSITRLYINRPRDLESLQNNFYIEFLKQILVALVWILGILSILIFFDWFQNLKPHWILFLYPSINISLFLGYLIVAYTNK
ncbi:hypothetical protein KGF54_003874 [Candida jiufengensis]|uniref:uncharacterized protein n=1 Tax=Candida jiufengensis TaxID=497108 RepID=UPI0022242CA9|nr:uncharacterized protein KGF54_003874 [Candida jiufengensis]KAI5950800.1 hypothetical protein KGF54_003874 [Candida jiufengensis]